jgi:hypothetical protein
MVALLADRAADEVGVFADECQVQHGASEPPETNAKSARLSARILSPNPPRRKRNRRLSPR